MMFSLVHRIGYLIGLAALLAPGLACADITLGHSGDLSGTSASLTRDYLRGLTAYFDEVNRKGGIRGEKIKLVSLDDAFNPDRTVENTKALIERNALALVGYRGANNMQRIIPLIQAVGIAQIGNTSGASALREPFVANVFHLRASTKDEVDAIIGHAWTTGVTKFSIAYQDDAFGKDGLEALNASLKKRGTVPVAAGPVPRGTVDVDKAVNLITAAKPQAVLLVVQAKAAAALVRGLHAQGQRPQTMVLSVASGVHAELGDQAAGIVASQVVPYPFADLGAPVVREYQRIIGTLSDKKYSYSSMEGFINAKLVVAALQKTQQPLTRAKVLSTLEGMTDEDLGGYAVSYGKQNNLGSRFVSLTMIRKDGTFAR